MNTLCYIGLGSNLDDPLRQLQSAVKHLQANADISKLNVSPLYRSKAVGPGDQADYLNAVASLQTELAATDLLALLHRIEDQHGRTRNVRWGSRTLDLDLLLYGQECIESPTLSVPHPRIKERNFVLKPLLDLAPTLILPDGAAVSSLSRDAGDDGLTLLQQHWL